MKPILRILALATAAFLFTAGASLGRGGLPSAGIPPELRQIVDENRNIALPPPRAKALTPDYDIR